MFLGQSVRGNSIVDGVDYGVMGISNTASLVAVVPVMCMNLPNSGFPRAIDTTLTCGREV